MIRETVRHVLGGLQAGMLGAIVMLVWLMLGSMMNRHSAWQVPNLFGTTFYGSDAYRNAFITASWSGLALILAIYSACGMLWGLVWGERRQPLLVLYGGVAGLLAYFFFFRFIWPHANPALALYAPTRQLQIAHVLWGMILARSPRYAAQLAS